MRRLRPYIPAILIAATIFGLSSLPGLLAWPQPMLSDKILHATIYALLAYFLMRAIMQPQRRVRRRWCLVIGVAVLYGVSDEWHQYFVPGRSPDHWDLVADALGAVLGAQVWVSLNFRWPSAARNCVRPSSSASPAAWIP